MYFPALFPGNEIAVFKASVRWCFDVAALQQVIETTDPIPTIAVTLKEQTVLSIFPSSTVILCQQVDEQAPVITSQSTGERHFPGDPIQVMDEQDRVVAPVIADREHRWISNRDHFKVAPAHLRNFLTHTNNTLSPI